MAGRPRRIVNPLGLEDRLFYWRSWDNERHIFSLRKDREEVVEENGWLHKRNPPAFMIGNRVTSIIDPFHLPEQYLILKNEGNLPSSRPTTELLRMLKEFEGLIAREQSERVVSEFANEEFRKVLNGVRKEGVKRKEIQARIGVLKEKKLAKLKLIKQLCPSLIRIKESRNISKKEVARLFRVPLNFLNQCFDFINDKIRFHEEIALIENQLSKERNQNDNFLRFFKRNKLKFRTRRELYQEFRLVEDNLTVRSLTDFDRKMLRSNRISYQKCKLIYDRKRLMEKKICRIHFIERLLVSHESDNELIFFDETSFELRSTATFAYSEMGQRPLVPFNIAPLFLHVLLISSLWGVEAYLMSFKSITSECVESFLNEYLVNKAMEKNYTICPLVMIMDNSPKNRSAAVKEMAKNRRLSILYTVPCSPFLNQVETVFNFLKRSVQRHPEYPFQ